MHKHYLFHTTIPFIISMDKQFLGAPVEEGLVGDSEEALEFVGGIIQRKFPPPPREEAEEQTRRKKPSQKERRAAQGKRNDREGSSRSSTPIPTASSRVVPISSTPNVSGGYRKRAEEEEEGIYYVAKRDGAKAPMTKSDDRARDVEDGSPRPVDNPPKEARSEDKKKKEKGKGGSSRLSAQEEPASVCSCQDQAISPPTCAPIILGNDTHFVRDYLSIPSMPQSGEMDRRGEENSVPEIPSRILRLQSTNSAAAKSGRKEAKSNRSKQPPALSQNEKVEATSSGDDPSIPPSREDLSPPISGVTWSRIQDDAYQAFLSSFS
ncbi:hypothetical protein BJ684DRAFT_15741 [Piptocephalis cylindrospora]|uniref:Uncharacterized protein n=1 Tax=Piptocephalis cylindrospora TaxID=1907219 RepID=A0A4P9Y524_9FUNG|nr:hypothetical protein BJ684DRAFT_15741 [Piptocephalis cylindrospora]|eukprot:RKP13904.1 hypothetical protein BJ684DRAFT_15741 [Piptocephalis cylindrospora]